MNQIRAQIRNLKEEEDEYSAKLKGVRKGLIKGDEALMSAEDKEEMELSLRKLRRQVRVFHKAIRVCREKWQEMKADGRVPESSGAKKLRETLMARRAARAFGRGLRGGGGGGGGNGEGGLEEGEGKGVSVEVREKEVKVKVLQFGFGAALNGHRATRQGGGAQSTREPQDGKIERLKKLFQMSLERGRGQGTVQWGFGGGLGGGEERERKTKKLDAKERFKGLVGGSQASFKQFSMSG